MDLLLDTHALLWFMDAPEKLSTVAYEAILDESHRVLISMVSLWEIQIKTQRGKLILDAPLSELIETQQIENGMTLLPIQPHHIYRLETLPNHHGDPFDRLLIAQASAEGYRLVTKDSNIQAYQSLVQLLW